MTSLRKMEFDLAIETARKLGDLGLDAPLAEVIRSKKAEEAVREWISVGREMILPADPELAKAIVRAALAAKEEYLNKNPFEIPVSEILTRFHEVHEKEGESVPEETMNRLAATAPQWPKGRDVFLSIRERWGEGREGVVQTFERHVSRIRTVFGPEKFWRWEYLLSGEHLYKGKLVDRLRLLAGNDTHHAVVEWTVVDLSANRERESVTAVRGFASIADEGLSLVPLHFGRVRAIDYDKLPAWYCAGYELDVPEYVGESWRSVPIVCFARDVAGVELRARWRSSDNPDYSVPVARECQR